MRVVLLILALAIGGCGDRRTFDERYDGTRQKLDQKAKELDANLAANEAGPA